MEEVVSGQLSKVGAGGGERETTWSHKALWEALLPAQPLPARKAEEAGRAGLGHITDAETEKHGSQGG